MIRKLAKAIAPSSRQYSARVPNAKTIKAMKEMEAGKGKRLVSIDEIFEQPGKPEPSTDNANDVQ